jgi:two-component system, OmpR family, sensor kinase
VSLRTRLLLVLGVVAIVALVIADIATYSELRSFLVGQVDQSLQQEARPLAQGMQSSNGPPCGFGQGDAGPTDAGDGSNHPGPGLTQAPGAYVEVRSSSSGSTICSPARVPGGDNFTPRLASSITGLSEGSRPVKYFDAASTESGGPQFRVRVEAFSNGDQLIVATPISGTLNTLHRLLLIELAVSAVAVLIVGVGGFWLVRLGLRPLADIERTADAIAAGELDQRVPGDTRRTEVGHLARALNVMLERIQRAFAERDATEAALRRSEGRLRRFVADASHELRTPVAAVSAYAELFERGAGQRPEDLGRVMRGIRSETDRMGHLVEDLLLLARVDEGLPLERVPVEMVGLAAGAVDAARAVGPDWSVQLEATEPVEIIGDRVRLRQVLDNLLANVRAHTPPGTETVVRIVRQGDVAVAQVADNGPGFSEEQARRVFERFYRVDESRSRESGGAGLGLSIVAAIVTAHGGTVGARPGPGGGAEFTVRLPVNTQ